MIRIAALIGLVLAGAQLTGCDVQTSQGSGGAKAERTAPRAPLGGTALAITEAQQRAVSVKLKAELRMVRNTCEMYQAENGRYPDFASGGWSELTRYGYLRQEPRNPLSPKSVATKILVTDRPGVTGAHIDPSQTGWVFNTSSGWGGMMYGAGVGD
jgi:hypothetical protein